MSDRAVLARATTQVHSLSLTAEAGVVAEALATVIERLDSADHAAAATVSFLRSWGDQARRGLTMGPVPGARSPLDSLTARLGLTNTERLLVVLAGLAEEHEGLAGTLRSLHPLGEPRPTVGLSALVLAESGVDRIEVRRLLGEGSAVRLGVLRITGSSGLFERSLTLADQLWVALHGVDSTPPGLQRIDLGPASAGLDAWLDDELVQRAGQVIRDGGEATVICYATEESIAMGRCAALLAAVGGQVFAVRADTADAALDAARQTAVHAAARDAVPVLLLHRPAASDREHGPVRGDWAGDLPGPLVLCTTTGSVHLDGTRPVIALPAGPVPAEQRRVAWHAVLPGIDDSTARSLAARLPLDPTWIATVARDVRVAGHKASVAAASAALRRRTGAVLPLGAELITPAVPWERLVLPEEAGFQLRDAVARLVHQGTVLDDWEMSRTARARRGARLLLTGRPGTGKSLAAEVLATAAQTDLLRVDLSQIVSKWLGETEKNLAGVFDAAERTQAVLVLDEADALFGTRTEISDAHDRYANLETAYLLQRLESFEGLLVLTTNLRHNIDAAFVRRMDFVVDVPLPDQAARRELWRLHLPTGHVADEVDLDVLARMYAVPGGWIRNAALTAAFAAAAAGNAIHQHHLIAAVQREYAKAALPFPGEPPRRRDEH
jgi:ATPase family associated with various cellular activities (AAA)